MVVSFSSMLTSPVRAFSKVARTDVKLALPRKANNSII